MPLKQGSFGGATTKRGRGDGTPVDLFFARASVAKAPLLVFTHIRKTAGTSLRRSIAANYSHARYRHLFMRVPKTAEEGPLHDWYRELYHERLVQKERARLVCIASHSANYLLPALDRPYRVITMLRDPVDRVLSRYYFFGREPEWSLKDIYTKPGKARQALAFFNGQSRALLEPHFDLSELPPTLEQPPDANLWRARLFSTLSANGYLVGIQERFEESVQRFAAALGWRHAIVSESRVNRTRPETIELDEKTHDLILRANWLDVELYRHFAENFGSLDDSLGDDRPGRGYRAPSPPVPKTMAGVREELEALRKVHREDGVALRARIDALQQQVRDLEAALRRRGGAPPPPAKSKKKPSKPGLEATRSTVAGNGDASGIQDAPGDDAHPGQVPADNAGPPAQG
jgi:Sulfotransferase family